MTLIRRLEKSDIGPDLLALSRQFFAEYEDHHAEFFKIDQLRDADVETYFARFIDQEDSTAFVAAADGDIVGYITVYVQAQPDFWRVKRVGAISGLMVRPDYRRRGIGSQLMAKAAAFFAARGVRYFTVFTAASNQAALDFCARSGMVPLYVTLIGNISGTCMIS